MTLKGKYKQLLTSSWIVFFEQQVIREKYAVFPISCTTPNRLYCVILKSNYHSFPFQLSHACTEFPYESNYICIHDDDCSMLQYLKITPQMTQLWNFRNFSYVAWYDYFFKKDLKIRWKERVLAHAERSMEMVLNKHELDKVVLMCGV